MKKKKPTNLQNNGAKRKAMCRCGHVGDSPFTAHEDTPLEPGHGRCMIEGCKCRRFVWSEFV